MASETRERETGHPAQETLRSHERTGRPLGGVDFIEPLESALHRHLRPQKTGAKEKEGPEIGIVSPDFDTRAGRFVIGAKQGASHPSFHLLYLSRYAGRTGGTGQTRLPAAAQAL